ncbi:protein transport protein Sec23 [Trypanosoma rangeli SC58]|uniref:Protein transport protein SEC23 n=1 Tax=Trypanosoma rangeli SC58 TaxID=429131 RepID=A0A061JC11_TRYRA|nr:protein transport protein Sec23 [Trypanosoma rangeli SC58]
MNTTADALASPLMSQGASAMAYTNAADSALASGQDAPSAALNATDVNGLRWTWSTYPNTYRDAKHDPVSVASITLPEMIVPLACMYTPLKPLETCHFVIGDPAARGQQCPNCGAFWNKHCYREEGKFWMCPSCLRRSPMPPNYSAEHPALHHDTVEYIIPSAAPTAAAGEAVDATAKHTYPTFIFIIDICLPVEELESLKQSILRCLNWLPPQSLVGFISFGARTSVWELGTTMMTRCYSLRGEKQYDPAELSAMLQVTDAMPVRGRFLALLEDCEFVLTALIEELQCDDSVTPGNKRPLRTTGTAISVAVRLLELLYEKPTAKEAKATAAASAPAVKAGRLMLFTGGPCTRGPGTVVGIEKEKMMRFHRDIIDGDTPYYADAFNLYNNLQQRLSNVQASLDVFAESFDQTGILEMREAVNQTGGTFICGDTFSHKMFTTSFQRYFDRFDSRVQAQEEHGAAFSVRSAFCVKFGVHTSVDTLVSGVLGPCLVDEQANKTSLHRAASPIQIGVGGTTNWCVSTLDEAVTYTFLFDTATMSKKDGGDAVGTKDPRGNEARRRFFQFVVRFITPHGESRVRVTSVVLPVAPSLPSIDPQYFVLHQAFDQTCAATVLARMVVSILEKHPSKWDDTKRWLDTLLVRFVRRYGTFRPGVPESLRLHPCLSLFPSFLFNLRRSEYFMVLNISPDETTFKRHWLMRDSVDNCVLMIQPALYSYDIEAPQASPVPLDSCSLRPDNILLMDAYFNIHIMWGTTIFAWIQAKYQENPEYTYFAQLLDTVESDAIGLLSTRYPYPRFSRTDANGSEARHIKTRMNPTTTHHSGPIGAAAAGIGATAEGDQSDVIYTDEASIMKFMESLKQAVVSLGNGGSGTGSRSF